MPPSSLAPGARARRAGCAALLLLAAVATATATEIAVSVSFPAVYEFVPPLDRTLEGSRTVTAQADAEIHPAGSYPWLVPLSVTTYATTFLWHETQPRVAHFTDAAGDTLEVVFAPGSAMPLDLARHDLPVVHIVTDPAHLWDQDTGIYVWGQHDNFLQRGEAWERPATLSYYDADGSLAFCEPIGLRINGESSREYAQKGLRLYFDDYGPVDFVEHDFFGDGPVRCERLVLRGNRYPRFAIGSAMMEPLHRELDHPGSRWAYVAVYLNDEYWGAYSLRERFDGKWIETTHEWADGDDCVLVKDHEAEVGDYARWEQVLAGCQPPADPTRHDWFQWLERELDVTAYLDWILVNAAGMTADNMAGKNLAILKVGGGPFRYMTWDEDILYQSGNRDADHFAFFAAGDAAEFQATRPPVWFSGGPWEFTFAWNQLLRAGMRNAEFKARLRARAAELLAGPLSADALDARLSAVAAIQAPEWLYHDARWLSPGTYDANVATVRALLAPREATVRQQVAAFLASWADPVELTRFQAAAEPGAVRLVWRTEREVDCAGWIVQRAEGEAADLVAVAGWPGDPGLVAGGAPDAPCDYAWRDEGAPVGVDLRYRLAHVSAAGDTTVHPWIERLGLPPSFALRLNEILADNDHVNPDEAGQFDDWLELVNTGGAPASLAGLYLTDDLDDPTRWALPAIDLAAGEFLLVWCDGDPGQGPLHATFALSKNGEEVGLFSSPADGSLPIDTLVFGAQTTDVSLGRAIDGSGPWVLLAEPTPGASNEPDTAVEAPGGAALRLDRPWPNPAAGGVRLSGRLPGVRRPAALRVFDARGALVREVWTGAGDGDRTWTWDGRDAAGRRVPAGVYLLRLQAGAALRQQRVVLVR